jgi:ADP-heptose:LPS heptosyltransferase
MNSGIERMFMKIMVVQVNRIGDLILITPLLKALKDKYAGAEIHFLAGRKNYDVAYNHPLIDRTYVYRKDPFSIIKLILQLRLKKFDMWIDPRDHESSEGTFLARIAWAKIKIGFNAPGSSVFTHPMKSDSELSGLHYTTRVLTALEHLGETSPDNRPVLYVAPDSEEYLNNYLEQVNTNKYYCLNISSNGPDRSWPYDKWIEFVDAIDTKNHDLIIISMPEDFTSAEHIINNRSGVHLFKSRSIIDIFSLVNRSEMVITVDTSIVHIASAFNKPVLALYVNLQNFYSQYLPLSDIYRIVTSTEEGDPVSKIPVEDVINNYVSLQLAIQTSGST